MSENYVQNYICAIENPLPEMVDTFHEELEMLKNHCNKDSIVLDVGSGAGRPANMLSEYVKKIVCIDNDEKMLLAAKERYGDSANIDFLNEDALALTFPNDSFDLAYATYNLVGWLKKSERQQLIDEMRRVAKEGTRIINLTWKDDKETTEFLKRYYPAIGVDIIEADEGKTVTSKGVIERISKDELLEYYKGAELKDINFIEVNPVWVAIVGTK